jgi:hypothetical protein
MLNKTEGKKTIGAEKNFNTWTGSYTAASKMWEDSYLGLYNPWVKSYE